MPRSPGNVDSAGASPSMSDPTSETAMNGVRSGTIVERLIGRPLAALRVDAQRLPPQRDSLSQAAPAGAGLDAMQLIALLNDALATEWVCALRHRRQYYAGKVGARCARASAAWRQAALELEHADRIAARIIELGGEPDLDPDRLSARSHAMYRPLPRFGDKGDTDELCAERVAIETYREMLEFVDSHDPTTRRLLEDVLAIEEAHVRQAQAKRA